jgi:hypothetical protein
MFGSILKGAVSLAKAGGGALASVGRAANKIPGVGAIPVVGNVLAAAGGLATVSSMVGGGGGGSAGLPMLPSGGLPAIPGQGALAQMGERGWFSNDPNIPDFLKPFAISKGNLKTYYKGPKGTVIVHDSAGDPYALDRRLAIRFKLWKPAHKPPISVGDWQSVKRADRTVKKMRKIFRTTTRVDSKVTGGKVVVAGRKKKKG